MSVCGITLRHMPRNKLRRATLSTLFGAAHSVQCSEIGAFEGATDTDAKWVHVAVEGAYLGYLGGEKPFVFSRLNFEQAVANVRSHPNFVLGANGEGSADVIPWDYNHASEQDPTSGDLPISGAPAQGWTRDLKIVDADGKAHLYALTRFLEPARTYVKAGQYKWASVAANLRATDPVTAQDVGMQITSIALTNTPFIEGMNTLVASRQGQADVSLMSRYYGQASTAQEALESFKEMLSLPVTGDLSAVSSEIAKISSWVATGATPLGVNIEDIVGCMRQILGLPALTPIASVLANASEIVQRFLEEQAVVAGQPLTPPTAANNVPAATMAAARRNEQMDLLKILAGKLSVRESEEAVVALSVENMELRSQLVALTGAKDNMTVLLKAVADGKAAREKLTTLLQALGIEDAEGGVEKIATLMASAESLKAAMPELEALRATQAVAEEQAAETDVTQAMAARGYSDEGLKTSLMLFRKSDPAAFAKKFPAVVPPAMQPAVSRVLTQTLVASRNGAEHTARGAANSIQASQTSAQPTLGGQAQITLSMYPGANPTEKAMSYLEATMDGYANLPYDKKFSIALTFKRQPHVICA